MKRFPKNVVAFRIGDWPVNHFNQKMLRSLSRIADGRGWTIEEAITRTVREFLAECELEEKIIKFPKATLVHAFALSEVFHYSNIDDTTPANSS